MAERTRNFVTSVELCLYTSRSWTIASRISDVIARIFKKKKKKNVLPGAEYSAAVRNFYFHDIDSCRSILENASRAILRKIFRWLRVSQSRESSKAGWLDEGRSVETSNSQHTRLCEGKARALKCGGPRAERISIWLAKEGRKQGEGGGVATTANTTTPYEPARSIVTTLLEQIEKERGRAGERVVRKKRRWSKRGWDKLPRDLTMSPLSRFFSLSPSFSLSPAFFLSVPSLPFPLFHSRSVTCYLLRPMSRCAKLFRCLSTHSGSRLSARAEFMIFARDH